MKTLEVDLGNRSYPIHIGTDLIDQAELFCACEKSTSIYIVTNTTVAPLYAERLTKTLEKLASLSERLSCLTASLIKTGKIFS